MTPQSCTICNRLSIRRLPEDFQISAAINEKTGNALLHSSVRLQVTSSLCGLQTSQSCPR